MLFCAYFLERLNTVEVISGFLSMFWQNVKSERTYFTRVGIQGKKLITHEMLNGAESVNMKVEKKVVVSLVFWQSLDYYILVTIYRELKIITLNIYSTD